MNSSIFTQSEVDGLIKKITDLTRDQFSIPKVGFTSSRLRLAVAYYHLTHEGGPLLVPLASSVW